MSMEHGGLPRVMTPPWVITSSVQTWTAAQTFNSSMLLVRNPADTFSYTIAGGAILADRTLSLPVLTGADTVAVLGVTQTFTGQKTFNSTYTLINILSFPTDIAPTGSVDEARLAGADFAAGDRRLYIGSELGSNIIIGNNQLRVGLAGTGTGSYVMEGATSGVVTLTVAAVAGTWTMTLPAAVGAAGQQLTDAGGNGATSWAAASLGAWKHDLGILDPEEALMAVVKAPTHRFTYDPDVMPPGQWAPPDEMAGVFAEEAPWAMHGKRDGLRSGIAFSQINSFGYARAAIEALYDRTTRLERRLIKAGLTLED